MPVQKKMTIFSTLLGIFALAFWAFAALCAVELKQLPLYEYLFIIFFAGFVLTAIRYTAENRWREVIQHWKECLIAGVLLAAFAICYYMAFRCAPAAQVDIVNYLWPVFVLVGSSFLPGERFSWSYLLSGIIGFSAIFLLMAVSEGLGSLQGEHASGYLLAFLGACFWALFSLYSRKKKHLPSDMTGIYCGFTAAVFFLLHLCTETFVVPNGHQTATLLFTGFGPTALAFWFWDIGIKKGHYRLLTLMSYFTSTFSIGILILFGQIEYHPILFVSCGMIVFASALPKLIQVVPGLISSFYPPKLAQKTRPSYPLRRAESKA